MRSGSRRAALAIARAWSVPAALVGVVVVLGVGFLVGPVLLAVPGAQVSVAVWRVVPALVASCAAFLVAPAWVAFERAGCRSPVRLAGARVAAALVVVALGALVLAAGAPSGGGLAAVTLACFAVLAPLALALPQQWGFAVPVLLFALVYLPLDLLPQ